MIGKLSPEILRRGGAARPFDLLAYDRLSVELGSEGVGIAALARVDSRDDIDHHLAFCGVTVNLVEQQMLARLVVAAKKLQADLALIRDLRPGSRVKIVDNQSCRGKKKLKIARDADSIAILSLYLKGPDIVVDASGEFLQIRNRS